MPSSSAGRRHAALHLLLFIGVVCALIAAALFAGFTFIAGEPTVGEPHCTVDAQGDSPHVFSPDQSRNASLISAEALARNLDHRASVIALATAQQESGLINLDHGDRDSVGLFQQRPSQGWGSVAEIMDPHYATESFYNHLVHVDYHSMSVTRAAQAVQQSGAPGAYAQHEESSTALTEAFHGSRAASLNCILDPVEESGPSTPSASTRAHDAVSELETDYGGTLGNARAQGETAVLDPRSDPAGWSAAHWAVANAERLGITRVSFAGRTWDRGHQASTRLSPPKGWEPTAEVYDGEAPSSTQVVVGTATNQ